MLEYNPGDNPRQQAWTSFVSLAEHTSYIVNSRLRRQCQLTHVEFRILDELADQPDQRLSLSTLAFAVDSSISRLAGRLMVMERRGLIERVSRTPGSRLKNVVLTDVGAEVYEAAAPVYDGIARSLVLDGLADDEVAQWLLLTRRMLARVVARDGLTAAGTLTERRRIVG